MIRYGVYAHPEIPRFIINPGEAYDPYDDHFPEGYEHIKENATTGVETFIEKLIELCGKSAQYYMTRIRANKRERIVELLVPRCHEA